MTHSCHVLPNQSIITLDQHDSCPLMCSRVGDTPRCPTAPAALHMHTVHLTSAASRSQAANRAAVCVPPLRPALRRPALSEALQRALPGAASWGGGCMAPHASNNNARAQYLYACVCQHAASVCTWASCCCVTLLAPRPATPRLPGARCCLAAIRHGLPPRMLGSLQLPS